MIIRKTEWTYKKFEKSWINYDPMKKETHIVSIKRSTIWLLFIPIFWYEKIMSSNI